MCLSDKDCQEVFSRWVDHLMSPHCNQKQFALLFLLSMGMFDRVVEMLYNMRYFDIAAIFVDCCQQWGILDSSDLPEGILLYSCFIEVCVSACIIHQPCAFPTKFMIVRRYNHMVYLILTVWALAAFL